MLHSSEICFRSNIKNQLTDPKKVSERAWMQLSTYQPITKKYPTYLQFGMIDILKNQTHLLIGKPTCPTNKHIKVLYWLVVSTHLKNMIVKMGSSSPNRVENQKCLSCHHLDLYRLILMATCKPWASFILLFLALESSSFFHFFSPA